MSDRKTLLQSIWSLCKTLLFIIMMSHTALRFYINQEAGALCYHCPFYFSTLALNYRGHKTSPEFGHFCVGCYFEIFCSGVLVTGLKWGLTDQSQSKLVSCLKAFAKRQRHSCFKISDCNRKRSAQSSYAIFISLRCRVDVLFLAHYSSWMGHYRCGRA